MKNKRAYLLFCVSCLLLSGCDDPGTRPKLIQLEVPHKRVLSENPKRVLLGMRPIGEKWICFRSIDGHDEWIGDPVNDPAAIKWVDRDSEGNPVQESDAYYSGRLFVNEEGDEQRERGLGWSATGRLAKFLCHTLEMTGDWKKPLMHCLHFLPKHGHAIWILLQVSSRSGNRSKMIHSLIRRSPPRPDYTPVSTSCTAMAARV